jgi:hypothetical protein
VFRAYVTAVELPPGAAPNTLDGRHVVCLAEAYSLEVLRIEIADAWDGQGELIVTAPDGAIVADGWIRT